MKNILLSIITFSFILGTNLSLFSQDSLAVEDLTKSQSFFDTTLLDYKDWLNSSDMGYVLRVEDMVVYDDMLLLDLKVSSAAAWYSLEEQYAISTNGDTLSKRLFNKLAFLMEIDRMQTGVRVRSDKNDFYADIFYKNNQVKARMSGLQKGEIDGFLKLDLSNHVKDAKGKGAKNIITTKRILKANLPKFYKDKSNFFQTVKVDTYEEKRLLNFTIYNIKKELIHDDLFGYFERIDIEMTFTEEEGEVTIKYHIDCKYGSGIFTAPRMSGYTPLKKYKNSEDYLKRYNRVIRGIVNEWFEEKE